MKFWIYTVGRTGSVRLVKMITESNHQHFGTIKIQMSNKQDEHYVYHVHDTSIPPPDDAVKILSTRKSMKDIILSHHIGHKTGAWQPILQKGIKLSPFHVSEEEYMKDYLNYLRLEQEYVDKYSPIIVYLEDSIEDIENKLGIQLPYPNNDTAYISKFPPKEYIINYSELPTDLEKMAFRSFRNKR